MIFCADSAILVTKKIAPLAQHALHQANHTAKGAIIAIPKG